MATDFWQIDSDTAPPPPPATGTRGISGADYPSNNSWDVAFLDGDPLPGLCDVKGLAQLRVDTSGAKGSNGANLKILGYLPGPFELLVKTWTPGQEEILQDFIDRVWNQPRLDKSPTAALKKARPISHPKLARYNIAYCVIQGVTLPEPGPEAGTMVTRFKCNEARPPGKKNTARTVKASGVTRVKQYASGNEPHNGAPVAPSKNPKNLAPDGPPAAAAVGAH